MDAKMRRKVRRMGEGRLSPESSPKTIQAGELERATIVTTVRRLGFIMVKMHEVIMGRLIRQQEHEMAEQFNDLFKPLADLLVHFTLDDTLESEEEQGGGDGQL